jgi:hypothetical protein
LAWGFENKKKKKRSRSIEKGRKIKKRKRKKIREIVESTFIPVKVLPCRFVVPHAAAADSL